MNFGYLIGVLGVLASEAVSANYTDFLAKQPLDATERQARGGIISFRPIGKTVNLGLDILLPFVKVPLKRQKDDEDLALLNINTAAVVTGALIGGAGLLISFIFKTIGFDSNELRESDDNRRRRQLDESESGFAHVFDSFKLRYTNASGQKTETSLPLLIATIEDRLPDGDVDLSSCFQKSICSLVSKASLKMRSGHASGVLKIVDGVSSLAWLLHFLRHSVVREAIEAGKLASSAFCDIKYPACKWVQPEEKLFELIRKNVRFT